MKKNSRVLFYASVSDKKLFEITGFYKTDISILRELGFDVCLSNSYKDFLYFWKYDLSFIYFWTRGIVPAMISKILGKKVVFTGGADDIDEEYNKRKFHHFIRKMIFRACVFFSDINIISSQSDLNNVVRIGCKKSKLSLIPYVVDFEKYKYNGAPKTNTITTVVWMGAKTNVCRKGVDKLFYSFGELLKLNDTIKLVVIGTCGPGTDYLKQIADELKITDKIIFTGCISDEEKIAYLNKSKIYCQFSQFEGFGVATIEAMAAGNIVVHSGKGALKFVIGELGVELKDCSDYHGVACVLNDIYENYSQMSGKMLEGIRYIEDNYSYFIRRNKMLSLMHGLKLEKIHN